MCAAPATAASSRSLPASPGHPHGQRTQTRPAGPAGPIAAALGRAEPPGGRRGGGISSSGRPQQGGAERAPAYSSPNAASATILPGRGRSRAGRKAAPRCLRGTSGPAGRARGGSDRVVPQPLPRMCEVAAAAPARGSRAGGVSGGAARRSPRELQGAFI